MEGRVLVNQIILDKVFETFAKRNPNKKRTVSKLLEDLQYFVEESNDTLKNTYNEKYFDELSIKKVNDALLRGNQKQHGAEKEFRDLLCLYAYDGLDYKTVLIKVLNTSESEEKRLSDRIKLGLSGNEERDIGSFIKNFGISEHSRYAKIDDLYVPPKEYEEIKNTLENERIVFISGTPEFGKTYTAVKLLWEWYKNGYDVEWNQGNDETEREKVRNSFGTKLDSLKSGTIYYYEDPFGKIKYENKSGELELKISQIIRSIQSVSNVFVIITSREDVFDEFKKRSLSKSELEQFEKKLSIISPSYDEHKREEIILKYGDYFKCEWLSSPELKEYVIRKIKRDNILPSPLSIFNFSDISKNDFNIEQLNINFQKASLEIGKQFALEILAMEEDEQLFFTILFLDKNERFIFFVLFIFFHSNRHSDSYPFENFYNDEMIFIFSESFQNIIEKYNNRKIEAKNLDENSDGELKRLDVFLKKINFIHSSYEQAWSFIKHDYSIVKIINEINAKLIETIKQDYNTFGFYSHFIIKNLKVFISEELKSLFFDYLLAHQIDNAIVIELISNYEELNEEIQSYLYHYIKNASVNDKDILLSNIIVKINKYPEWVLPLALNFGRWETGLVILDKWKLWSEDTLSKMNIKEDDVKIILAVIEKRNFNLEMLKELISQYNNLPTEILEIYTKSDLDNFLCKFIDVKSEKEMDEIFTDLIYYFISFPICIYKLMKRFGKDKTASAIIAVITTYTGLSSEIEKEYENIFCTIVKNGNAGWQTLCRTLDNYNNLSKRIIENIPSIIENPEIDLLQCINIVTYTSDIFGKPDFPLDKIQFLKVKIKSLKSISQCCEGANLVINKILDDKIKTELFKNKKLNQGLVKDILLNIYSSKENSKQNAIEYYNKAKKHLSPHYRNKIEIEFKKNNF